MDRTHLASLVKYALIDCANVRGPRTNQHRAAEAYVLLQAMHVMTGIDPDPDRDGIETALGDTIAHLFHLAHAHGIDLEHCIVTGRFHFTEELEEECHISA